MPEGQGLWPAFWMMPTDAVYGGWPQSGEIDIMELLGQEPSVYHTTIHFGQAWPNNQLSGTDFKINDGDFVNEFHEFALEWDENVLRWFLDGYLVFTQTPSDLGGQPWRFDQDFHFLLNLAVGGNWPGSPNSNTPFPGIFEVDYVRLYDLSEAPYLTGPQDVKNMEEGVKYAIMQFPENASFEWSIPDDAILISGEGSSEININFGEKSGPVRAVIDSDCGLDTVMVNVRVEPEFEAELVLENFDDDAQMLWDFSTGDYTDNFNNPERDDINESELCGKYIRDGGELYDVLLYKTSILQNANEFSDEQKKIRMDIWTDAPIGSEILIQLESTASEGSNYPTGRHSRYKAITTTQNHWETIVFDYLDRPDNSVCSSCVNKVIILYEPGQYSDHTYYYDNIEVLGSTEVNTANIFQENLFDIKVEPNPFMNEFSVSLGSDRQIDRIKLVDISGKYIMDLKGNQGSQMKIDGSNLTNGTYILMIIDQLGNQQIKKVIKN